MKKAPNRLWPGIQNIALTGRENMLFLSTNNVSKQNIIYTHTMYPSSSSLEVSIFVPLKMDEFLEAKGAKSLSS